jgi:hypothetical protein
LLLDLDGPLSILAMDPAYFTNQHEFRPFVNCLFVAFYQVYQFFFGQIPGQFHRGPKFFEDSADSVEPAGPF